MGLSPESGKIYGTEGTRRIDQENSQRRNISGTVINIKFGDSHLGKILERVELLEEAFYSYVHAHQNRLEARLGESKQLEKSFTEGLKLLKQEIYNLAEKENEKAEAQLEAELESEE